MGTCDLRSTPNGPVIDRADAHIGISDDLMRCILADECVDAVSIEQHTSYSLLTISAINRTVVYRVDEYDDSGVWYAELVA